MSSVTDTTPRGPRIFTILVDEEELELIRRALISYVPNRGALLIKQIREALNVCPTSKPAQTLA